MSKLVLTQVTLLTSNILDYDSLDGVGDVELVTLVVLLSDDIEEELSAVTDKGCFKPNLVIAWCSAMTANRASMLPLEGQSILRP